LLVPLLSSAISTIPYFCIKATAKICIKDLHIVIYTQNIKFLRLNPLWRSMQ
jgi:hypothetical protein